MPATIIAALLATLMLFTLLALGVDNLNAMATCLASHSHASCSYLLR